MKNNFIVRCIVALFFVTHTIPALANAPLPTDISASCKTFIEQTLPANGWAGDFIEVPQDWAQPNSGKKIKVFYYYDASRALQSSTPILILNGGPFKSYQSWMLALQKKVQKFDTKKNHTFVMMDQRGTGCSVPLMPEKNSSVAEISLYGSENIVKDAEAIRTSLFPQKQWKIFAQSYGGFLALRYLNLFPDKVSEFHVHGPTVHQSKKIFFRDRILRQNEIVPLFRAAYPKLDLDRAFEILAVNPGEKFCLAASGETQAVCGRPLLDAILAEIGQGRGRDEGTTEIWDGVAANIENLVNGDGAKFLTAATDNLAFFRLPSSLVVSVLWGQDLHLIDGTNRTECAAAYSDIQDNHQIDIAALALDHCRIIQTAVSNSQEQKLKNEYVPAPHILSHADALATLAKNPQIKFHLYTGELDTLAQLPHLRELVASPLVNHTHFLRSGHAGWMYEPVVWENLMQE